MDYAKQLANHPLLLLVVLPSPAASLAGWGLVTVVVSVTRDAIVVGDIVNLLRILQHSLTHCRPRRGTGKRTRTG